VSTGCATLSYLQGDSLMVTMSFGDRVLHNTTITGKFIGNWRKNANNFERTYDMSYVIPHADILVLGGGLKFANFHIWSFSF